VQDGDERQQHERAPRRDGGLLAKARDPGDARRAKDEARENADVEEPRDAQPPEVVFEEERMRPEKEPHVVEEEREPLAEARSETEVPEHGEAGTQLDRTEDGRAHREREPERRGDRDGLDRPRARHEGCDDRHEEREREPLFLRRRREKREDRGERGPPRRGGERLPSGRSHEAAEREERHQVLGASRDPADRLGPRRVHGHHEAGRERAEPRRARRAS
jgi:hypothetical protein